MSGKRRFPKSIVAAIRDGKILGIRAGTKPHRIIGIWAVVVEGRVFVRSYSLKQRSWYRTFLEEPRGIIEVDGKQIPVRPIFTRSERLKKLVDPDTPRNFPRPARVSLLKASRKRSVAIRRRNWSRFDPQIAPIPQKQNANREKAHRVGIV